MWSGVNVRGIGESPWVSKPAPGLRSIRWIWVVYRVRKAQKIWCRPIPPLLNGAQILVELCVASIPWESVTKVLVLVSIS